MCSGPQVHPLESGRPGETVTASAPPVPYLPVQMSVCLPMYLPMSIHRINAKRVAKTIRCRHRLRLQHREFGEGTMLTVKGIERILGQPHRMADKDTDMTRAENKFGRTPLAVCVCVCSRARAGVWACARMWLPTLSFLSLSVYRERKKEREMYIERGTTTQDRKMAQ